MKIKVSIAYGASKFDQKLSEAPAAVSILTATEIKRFGYRTLADILRSVRGFYTTYDRNYHYLGMHVFCFWWMVTRSMTMFTIRPAVIIQDLLPLARRGVAAAEVVNINEMIANYIKSPIHQKLALYHPNVIFKFELSPYLFIIKGSSVHLEKTFINLVSNATEAISGEGGVVIRTTNIRLDKPVQGYETVVPGEYAVLSVSGIQAEEYHGRIYLIYSNRFIRRKKWAGAAQVWD